MTMMLVTSTVQREIRLMGVDDQYRSPTLVRSLWLRKQLPNPKSTGAVRLRRRRGQQAA